MKRIFLVCLLGISGFSRMWCQTEIVMQGISMRVVEYQVYNLVIHHNDPIQPDDEKAVVAFKNYFNATSVTKFRSMFLPEDWTTTTPAEFSAWQQQLQKNPLQLKMALQLEDSQRNRYLVLRYIMPSTGIDYYQSKVMKSVRGEWKHRNLDTTGESIFFETIGSLDQQFLEPALSSQKPTLSLENLSADRIITHKIKYEMNELVLMIKEGLSGLLIHKEDIAHAGLLFSLGDAQGMVEYLSDEYALPANEIMEAVNEAVGFTYFQFAHIHNQPNK